MCKICQAKANFDEVSMKTLNLTVSLGKPFAMFARVPIEATNLLSRTTRTVAH